MNIHKKYIISTESWETVYDSGSILEETLRQHYPQIFNSESDGDKVQMDNFDGRSDDKGLEVPALTHVFAAPCM